MQSQNNIHKVRLLFLSEAIQYHFSTKQQLKDIITSIDSSANKDILTCVYLQYQKKKIPLQKVLKDMDKYLPTEQEIQSNEKDVIVSLIKLYKNRKDEVKKYIQKIQSCKEKLDKIYEKIQDMPSKQIFARKLAIMSEQQSTQSKINVQISMIISDPLARKLRKNQKQTLQPIIKQQPNLTGRHQSSIYNAFQENNMVAVNIQKHYATRAQLRKVLQEKSEQIYTFKVVQIFADAYLDKNGKVYLKLQSQNNIGLEDYYSMQEFLHHKTKADIVFFIGKGYYEAIKKPFLKTKNIFIAVDTYCIEEDQCLNIFMQSFYSCLFRKAKPHDCFTYAMKALENQKKSSNMKFKKYAYFCCCLHEHTPQCCWSDIAQIFGQSLAHKIFAHSEILKTSLSQRKANNDLLNQIKALLQIKKKNCCTVDSVCCSPDSHIYYKYKFINLVEDSLQQQAEQQPKKIYPLNHTFTGLPKQQVPKRNRHKNIYKLASKMLKFKNVLILQGPRMSGKNELLSLASKYILERRNDSIIIENISFQIENQANRIKQIQYIVNKYANTNKKVIICLLKPVQNINVFIQFLDEKKKVAWQNFYFIVFNRKDNIIKKKNIEICQIEQLTMHEIVYIILRQFKPSKLTTALQFFMSQMQKQIDIFESEKALKFIKFVEMLAGKKQIEQAKNQQIPDILKKQLLKYHNEQRNTLIEIKKKQIKLWIFLYILAMFRQGLHITTLTKIFLDNVLYKTILNFIKDISSEVLKTQINAQNQQQQFFQSIKVHLQSRELVGLIFNKRQIVNKKQYYSSEILTQQRQMHEGMIQHQKSEGQISTITPEQSLIIYFRKLSIKPIMTTFQFQCQFRFFDTLFQAAKTYIMNNINFKRYSRFWQEGIFMYVMESEVKKILQNCPSRNVSKQIVLHYEHLLVFLERLKKLKISEMEVQMRLKAIIFLVNISIVSKVLLKGRYFQRMQNIFIECLKQYTPQFLPEHYAKLQLRIILQNNSLRQQSLINAQKKDKEIFANLNNFEETLLNFQKNQNPDEKLQNLPKSQSSIDKLQKSEQNPIKSHYEDQRKRLKKCLLHLDNCIQIFAQTQTQREKYEKCLILKLKIYRLGILVIFEYYSNPKVTEQPQLHSNVEENIKVLLRKLQEQKVSLESYPQLKSDIKIGLGYLNYIKKAQDDSIWSNINNPTPQFQKVINYMLQQGNFLIGQKNLVLFMKARCFQKKKQPFLFTRKSYPLREFLMKNLSNHEANLCFFSLTRKNFNLLKKVSSFVLVITTDAYAEKNDSYKLLFQDSNGIEQDPVDTDKFLTSIKHINLILLCGLNVSKFVQQIPINQNNPWIVCIDNDLDLANSNIIKYDKVLKIENGPMLFQRKQTYFNFIDLFICRFFGLIVEQEGITYTSQQLEKEIQSGMDIIQRIMMLQWPMVSAIRKSLFLRIIPGRNQSQIQTSIDFPTFGEGTPQDVTMKVKQIPNNLLSSSLKGYHIVGRHGQIHEVIKYFETKQKSVVEIQGAIGSGKSCLLQQICWIFILKKKCQQGVYRFTMRKLKDCSLMDHIQIHHQYLLQCIESQKKRLFPLLIALDDLELKDLEENIDFFQKVFHSPNKIYIIYTTNDKRVYDVMQKKFTNINFHKLCIDKLSESQRYNLILSCLNSMKIDLPKQAEIVQELMNRQWESASIFLSQIINHKFLEKSVEMRDIRKEHEKVLGYLRDNLKANNQYIIKIVN